MRNYLIAIKPDGAIVRCFNDNVPDDFDLITYDHPQRDKYYDSNNDLKPQYWGYARYFGKKNQLEGAMSQIIKINSEQEVLVEDIKLLTINANQKIIIRMDESRAAIYKPEFFEKIIYFFHPIEVLFLPTTCEVCVVEREIV